MNLILAAFYIDDPSDHYRISKKGIFSEILKNSVEDIDDIWIIGDNLNSEIKSGNELGIKTIHITRDLKLSSNSATFSITSFKELENILS